MPQNVTDDKSTLVQVMAWCRQATSHYLNQCWLISPMPYGVTRPQWVNEVNPGWALLRQKHNKTMCIFYGTPISTDTVEQITQFTLRDIKVTRWYLNVLWYLVADDSTGMVRASHMVRAWRTARMLHTLRWNMKKKICKFPEGGATLDLCQ